MRSWNTLISIFSVTLPHQLPVDLVDEPSPETGNGRHARLAAQRLHRGLMDGFVSCVAANIEVIQNLRRSAHYCGQRVLVHLRVP